MKFKQLFIISAALIALCFDSCSKESEISPSETIVQNQPRRISYQGETGLYVEGISTNFSNYIVLSFESWDDVDKLLDRWNKVQYDTVTYDCELLGFHNDIVRSNVIYDSLYYSTLHALGLEYHDIYDNEFEVTENLFDEYFASSLTHYMDYFTTNVMLLGNDSAEVIEPIGNIDMFALCNPDGYFIVDGVLYKQVEDVIISSNDPNEDSRIIEIETINDLQHLWGSNISTKININWYRSRPITTSMSVEDYWLFINGFINQHRVWLNLTQRWSTPVETNNIGEYYSTITFEGYLNTPRLSNQNSYYKSTLTIINYRKKHNQVMWHRCKLPTNIQADITTSVRYETGFITEERENFDNIYEYEKKFYKKTYRWRSSAINHHVEIRDITFHAIVGTHLYFNNQRTSLSL